MGRSFIVYLFFKNPTNFLIEAQFSQKTYDKSERHLSQSALLGIQF